MRFTVSGATGFLGNRLTSFLRSEGHECAILSRGPAGRPGYHTWDPLSGLPPEESLLGSDAVIHLAGEPVAQRWTSSAKQRIRDSRVDGTRRMVESLARLKKRPEALICASAIGYYGERGDEILTESSAPGHGFLPEVCVEWEAAADRALELGMRVVKVRIGVVLGGEGGALAKMLPAFRAGLGGPLAGGRQWMSWVDAGDAVRMVAWAATRPEVRGPLNAVSPNPVINKDFTRSLGDTLRRPAVFPVPRLALQILFGEMAEVVVGSQRVLPQAALAGGFDFRCREVVESLRALL